MILMVFASSVWGKNTLPSGSRESASTATSYRSKCFVRGSLFQRRASRRSSLQSWGSRVDLAEARETGTPLSLAISPDQEVLASVSEARPGASSERAEDTSSLASAEIDLESATSEHSSRDDKAYEELLGVVAGGRDLSDGLSPFFGDLHDELARSWSKPYSSRVFVPSTSIYSTIVDSQARGYMMMPQVEETLAGYLSPGSSSSLKKPMLPTKPCRLTSSLVGKAYQAAGQAGASLHTMAVLQAYQADLLKDLSTGGTIDEEAFLELRRATDLSLRATKQTARAIGRSMAAMVSTERHLWLNLTGIKERDRSFLLDAPVSPSGLFGDAVNSVVTRFREARRHEEAFVRFLPRRAQASGPSATQSRPGLVSLRRDVQKESVASRAPPRKDWGAARRTPQSALKRPDLRSILTKKRIGAPSRHPQETTVLPPPPLVFRGAAVSDEVLHGRLPPAMFQDTVHLTSPQISEVSKLVPLSEKLAAWKLLPDISPWVVRTVEKGYRIQFAYRPPRFNGVVSTSVKPERVHLLTQELQTLLDKGAIEHVPLPDRDSGYYSRYFLVPKKDGGLRPILDLRGLNRYLRTYKFKMLTIKMIVSQIQSRDWFVTIDLKDAYFHVEILPQHRRFLRFAFGGEAYQYRVLPFGLALSPRTYTKCMDAALAPLRLQGIRILNYIDDWLILARSQELALRHRDVVLAHLRSLGLRLNAKKSVLSPAQRTTYLGVGFRSHGSCIHGDTFGSSAHETVPVVAQSPGISSKGQSPEANKGYAPGASYPFYVVQTPVSDLGSHSRSVLSLQDANDRRLPQGLGCGLEWPSSPRDLERSSSQLAHQLPRNDGCISGPEILSPAVKRLPCPSAGGQHSGGLLHKSPGRTAFAPPEQVSAAGSALGTGQVPVPQSDLYSGAYEYGSRLSVQTSCDTRGMETPPRSSQSNLGKILRSRGGPLCFTGDSTMSPLLLSDSSSSPGSGRDGPHVAQTASVRISPDCSAPGSPSQGPSTGVSPLIDSAPLADQSMVLRSNIPPRRLAVGDSGQERSPISGAGDNISSPARALEPSCLAPEGDQLRDAGLPADVVETILSARAPSTRRSYALKWRVFESWCVTHHADPVHCQVVSVLEFLQEKLSSGISPGTLRVYVAAISACHTLIDGVSVGKHPLVARFIRGARRLRPPTRATVPSWDLAIVLEENRDLQALATSPSCLDFAPGLVKAILHPHPNYLPKVPFLTINPVVLEAFSPPPFTSPEQERLHLLCPVRALQIYVHRTSQWRKSEQLFICYGGRNRGAAATKRIMSHWVRDAIALAYEARGQASPLELRAHSTRGVASSTAIARGAPLQQVCDAAGWSSPHTFIRFYSLDVHATPGSHVLESTSQSHV
ncbi:Transposon Ty3-G Gag-Pol polyprotein [Labeo rohita]|uniref:ribonuclease H n=1 Tax=Labeo rohita TaxID=84645 RepID=A0ABQ8M0M8_LABRO|nr:Transposon Ty3-G Gag-Pol polyprotein [Labeo rohita]